MTRARLAVCSILLVSHVSHVGCSVVGTIFQRNVAGLIGSPRALAHRITDPIRPEARLAILWVGHATTLIQIDDKLILTDPVFTDTIGQLSPRLVEPGIDVASLPPVDLALVSRPGARLAAYVWQPTYLLSRYRVGCRQSACAVDAAPGHPQTILGKCGVAQAEQLGHARRP